MKLSSCQKTHLAAIAACLFAIPALADPPAIGFQSGSTVLTVTVNEFGLSQTVQVGLPSFDLYQYLYTHDVIFSSKQLNHLECILVLTPSGDTVTDDRVAALAARVYQMYDNLVPVGSDYANLIAVTQDEIDQRNFEQRLFPIIEGVEFVRDTGAKAFVAVALGGTAAPDAINKTIIDAVTKAGLGYLKSATVDALFFGKKSQRASAFIWRQGYIWALMQKKAAAQDLQDDHITVDPLAVIASAGAATIISDTRQPFFDWHRSLYPKDITEQLKDMGKSVVIGELDTIAEMAFGLPSTVIDSSITCMAAKYFGSSGYTFAEQMINIDMMVKGFDILSNSGYLDLQEFNGTPFDLFARATLQSHTSGDVYFDNQRVENAPVLQQSLMRTYYSPASITDLAVAIQNYTRVQLSWTVPSDDMGAADVYRHEVAYSDRPITNEALWQAALGHWPYNGAPAGTTKTVTTPELESGREYYFSVRGLDDEGNYGPLSNSPRITVGAGVNPITIQLPDFPVDPLPGSSFADAHTYFVFYKHAGGVEPRARTIYIDGNPHGLSRVPGGNYKKGTLFRYRHTTPYAAGSTHTYHYEFSSGPHTKRFPDTGELSLEVDPVLYSESVNPQSSDTYELRTFRVTYRHPEAKWPTRAHLRLSNTQPVEMRVVSGTPLKGATYEARAYINRQNSDFYFDFSDGSTTFRHPASGTLSVAVASHIDAAVIRCAMPDSVECGQVIPVRPALRNVGTEWIADCTAYIKQNGTELDQSNVDYLSPGVTRSGAAAFEWQVPVSDSAQAYDIEVGIYPVPGETITSNNTLVFHYAVPPGRGRITGAVYDDLGVNPVADVLVQAFSDTNDAASVYTDSNGAFLLDGLVAGTYTVRGEKDGTEFLLNSREVHALQTTDVGQQLLDGVGIQQISSFTKDDRLNGLTISRFDGTVAFFHDDSLYLMHEDGTGLRKALDCDYAGGYYGPTFSPTRKELVFKATIGGDSALWRASYDSGLNISSPVLIHDSIITTNNSPFYWQPTFLPDGENILLWVSDWSAFYTLDRAGTSVTEAFTGVDLEGQLAYELSPMGDRLVTPNGLYDLDWNSNTVTKVWQMPPDTSGSYYYPRWTSDGQHIVYTEYHSGGPRTDIYVLEPFESNSIRRITFGDRGDQCAVTSRDNGTLFYTRETTASTIDQLWSMPLAWPEVYGSAFALSNRRATLDGDGTNDTITLSFRLNTNGFVSAKVLNVRNELVRSIYDATPMPAGTNSVMWDCRDDYDLSVPMGMYFLRVDILSPNGTDEAAYSYSTTVEAMYSVVTHEGLWVRFSPDDRSIYYRTSDNQVMRWSLESNSTEALGISGVRALDVAGSTILVAATNANYHFDFKAYSTNGTYLGTWLEDMNNNQTTLNCPDLKHGANEFLYSRKYWPPETEDWNVTLRTSGGSETDLATDSNPEIGPRFSPDNTELVYSLGDANCSWGDIWVVNSDGSSRTQITHHPLSERCPTFVPGCNRIAFSANWVDAVRGLWVSDRSGSALQCFVRSIDDAYGSFDIASDGQLLAWNAGVGINVAELPLHMNKGAIRGRILDDIHGVALPGVPVRAVQGSNIVAETRSNARGYFKLLNIREGTCEVVAGAGEYLETSTSGVSVAVAETTELGDLTVVPTPWAALSNPSPGLSVPALFPVQAQPSERCTRAEFQWRPSTNNLWTVGAYLAESNAYAATFSCVAAGWTSGTYQVRSVGFNVSDTPDPLPVSFSVAYDTQAPTLALSTGSGGGGAAPEALAEKGGDPAPLSDPVDEATVVDFATVFVGDGDGLNTTVFDVRYPGETNWIPFASRVSTNAPDKSFDSAFIPPNMDIEFRVRSYDHAGNMQTSAVLVVRKEIPGDTDGDGMTDAYENDHGLDMNDPADGEADNDDDGLSNLAESLVGSNIEVKDSDGDGLDDWQEVYCGTSPTNNSDYLKTLFGETDPAGGAIVVRWPSSDGLFYSLGRTTNLVEAFSTIATNLSATPPENSYTDTPVNATSPHFYRIEAE